VLAFTPDGPNGIVTASFTVHNQRSEIVLSGEHRHLIRRTPPSPEKEVQNV